MKGIDNSIRVQKMIGSRIRAAREHGKLSRNEFAELLLINEEYPEVTPRKGSNEITTPAEKLANRIKQWERGENPVGLEFIPAICDVLHCDVGYLFGNYEEYFHSVADISSMTGLSDENIYRLVFWYTSEDHRLHQIANICIDAANKCLCDYKGLHSARDKLLDRKNADDCPDCTDLSYSERYEKVLHQIQTEESADYMGCTLLKHQDAIKFYARNIANTLERYLEEVYTDGID